MKNTINIIFFRLEEDLPLVTEITQQYKTVEDYEIHSINTTDEVNQFVESAGNAIFIFKVASKLDLADAVEVLKTQKGMIKKGLFRPACLLHVSNKKIDGVLGKYGCADLLDPNIKSKSFSFKVDFWSRGFHAVLSKSESELSVKRNNSAQSQGEAEKSVSDFSFVYPLDLESDMWLIKNKNDCKRIVRRYLIKLQGPSTFIGQWVEHEGLGGDQKLWKWVFHRDEDLNFQFNKGFWIFSGSKPEFDWKTQMWNFSAEAPHLYFCTNKNEIYSRLKFNNRMVIITENSEYAKAKVDRIVESCNPKHQFAAEQELLESKSGINNAMNLGGDKLRGKSSTDNLGSSHYEGKSSTDHLDRGPLEGEISSPQHESGSLSGESSTDFLDYGPLSGKKAKNKQQEENSAIDFEPLSPLKPLSGQNQIDEVDRSPYSGKSDTDKLDYSPLSGSIDNSKNTAEEDLGDIYAQLKKTKKDDPIAKRQDIKPIEGAKKKTHGPVYYAEGEDGKEQIAEATFDLPFRNGTRSIEEDVLDAPMPHSALEKEQTAKPNEMDNVLELFQSAKELNLESGTITVTIKQKQLDGKEISLNCKFDDMFDQELVVIAPRNALQTDTEAFVNLVLDYSGRKVEVTSNVKVAASDQIDLEQDYIYMEFLDQIQDKLNAFMELYQERQESINYFMLSAKGY